MTKLEELCRAICIADGVDPDKEGAGLGTQMPEGAIYPLWQARERQVRAMLECLKKPDLDMFYAAGKVMQRANWTTRDMFEGIIDAILQEKINGGDIRTDDGGQPPAVAGSEGEKDGG
jgi:hypothetical protein